MNFDEISKAIGETAAGVEPAFAASTEPFKTFQKYLGLGGHCMKLLVLMKEGSMTNGEREKIAERLKELSAHVFLVFNRYDKAS